MYSLIRVWIGAKLARMLIQLRVVVRTTSATDSPSAPSLYWMPKNGIQSAVTSNSKPRAAGQVGRRAGRARRPTSASANPSATGRAALAGRIATAIAPTSGRNVTIVRIGRLGEVHRQRPTSTRYEPAMTIRPMAMPSA